MRLLRWERAVRAVRAEPMGPVEWAMAAVPAEPMAAGPVAVAPCRENRRPTCRRESYWHWHSVRDECVDSGAGTGKGGKDRRRRHFETAKCRQSARIC